jgi:hypothetical protein
MHRAIARRIRWSQLRSPPVNDVGGRVGASLRRSGRLLSTQATVDASPNESTHNIWWVLGLATAAASSSLLLNTAARCEEAAAESPTAESATAEEEEQEVEDPYENLPEEDEDTTCSMCNTFRKGPCRPTWRKLERCFKDNEKEENGAVKCMRYFKPHQTCLMEYTNLYQLISLAQKQELVHDIDLSITEKERRTWDPDVDWSLWVKFTGEVGLNFRETVRTPEVGDPLPLWKRLPENKEPVLLTIPVPLPKVDEESGMIVKVAYAVDQDGLVLGLTYNKEYGELTEQAEAKASGKEPESKDDAESTSTADKGAESESSESGVFEFDFFVLPGETKTVQICGLYSENPLTASPDKDILDAVLLKSGTHILKDIAERS